MNKDHFYERRIADMKSIYLYFIIRKRKQTLIVGLGILIFIVILYSPWSSNEKQIKTTTRVLMSRKPTPHRDDFKLTMPFVQPNLSPQDKNLYFVVVVNSAANGLKHRILRQTIRKTWGNSSESLGNIKKLKWKLFFALGIAGNQSDYAASLQEARDHNDVILGNFPDTYRNVVIKTFMGLLWSATEISCKYVMKTDDDVYVRVPPLMTWLENLGSPRSFYGGMISKFHLIPRNPLSKWFISFEQYGKKDWPPWCHGSYTVFSSDTIPRYLIYTYRRKPFHTDDAYLGVASEDLHIKAVQIPGFVIEHDDYDRVRSNKELNETLTIGHRVKPEFMIKYHRYYQRIT